MKIDHKDRKKFVQDVFYLTLGSNYANFLAAVRGIFIRRFIGPTFAGLLATLNTIFFFMMFVYRPLQGGVAREIPYFKGIKDPEAVKNLRNGSFTIVFILAILLNIGLFIASFIVPENETGLLRWSLRLWAAVSFFKAIGAFLVVVYRTEKAFFQVFKFFFLNATLLTVVGIVVTYFYGFRGLIITTLVVQAISAGYLFKFGRIRLKFIFNRTLARVMWRLIVRGTPLVINTIMFLAFRQLDRVMVIGFLGMTQMGFYSIGNMLCNMIFLIPTSIWQVVAPGFLERGARVKDNPTVLKGEVFHNTVTIAEIIPPAFTFGAFALPFLMQYILPNFEQGILPAQILVLGGFGIGVYHMFSKLFVITDKMRHLAEISFIMVVAAGVMNMWALSLETGIIGIAVATLASFFLYGMIVILVSGLTILRCSITELIGLMGKTYFPFLFTVAFFLVANHYYFPLNQGFLLDCQRFILGTLLIVISFIPFWIHVNKKTSLITTFAYDMWEKMVKLYKLILRK